MEVEEVEKLAKAAAAEKGLLWEKPTKARKIRRGWLGGTYYWRIRSNARKKGRNIIVEKEDATGEVLGVGFLPR